LEPIIHIEGLHYTYDAGGARPVTALRDVSLTIHQGEYVAILGHNGSGKSTLARLLNGLLSPTRGDVWVKGWNTRDGRHTLDIRSTVGMVFQIPDNQIVATIVEEEIAFGPENLGIPRNEIVRRVDWSLEQVAMLPFRHRAPHRLSGGQKQRISIAGVLAMQPAVLVLDEATAMLDPLGRHEVLEVVQRLHREQGVTVVAITHFMHEAVQADRVVVMAEGEVVLDCPPRQLFRQVERLRDLRLDVPPITQLALALRQFLPDLPTDVLTTEELVAAIGERVEIEEIEELGEIEETEQPLPTPHSPLPTPHSPLPTPHSLITVHDLAHYYMRGTPLEVKAIHDIDMEIGKGEIVGIIGHTGSGKSTVVQHFNGLMRPHEGSVRVLGRDMNEPNLDMMEIRRRVGLLFQMPEAQLFEQYVGDDVAYGPRNLKLSREEVRARVRKAMEAVGLGFEAYKDRLTFSLSGGEKRRVALAGVLALEPEVLVLDEPTAGLDPIGRQQLLEYLRVLNEQGVTLVIISHNMEELASICQRLYVIAEGQTVFGGTPDQVFGQTATLHQLGLDVPPVTQVIEMLTRRGLVAPGPTVYTLAQAVTRLSASAGRVQATRRELNQQL
jgi:energy-coupling factor transport system ATP-binding protein